MTGLSPRRIAVVSTSRADYGHLQWLVRDLRAHERVDLKVVAFGPHLSPEYGHTVDEIARDGVVVDEALETLLSSDTDVGMAKSLGLATLSLADALGRLRPDLLVVTADRYEMLAAANVALTLRIPIAHVEGGERSEGAIDDAVRHALTKLSHLHFTTTDTARRRVIAMGEESWRVHQVGALSLDRVRRGPIATPGEVAALLDIDLQSPLFIVAAHAETLASKPAAWTTELVAALERLEGQIVFCFPNADAGSHEILDRARAFVAAHTRARLTTNLAPRDYWGLLAACDVVIGNSSSGVMEAASVGKPAVNVGIRQDGREHGANVVDVGAERDAIVEAVRHVRTPAFQQMLPTVVNPYGDGHAAERIAEVLAKVSIDERLLVKRAVAPGAAG